MHGASLALFVAVIALVGVGPLAMLAIWLVRRNRSVNATNPKERPHPRGSGLDRDAAPFLLPALAVALALVAVAALGTAAYLAVTSGRAALDATPPQGPAATTPAAIPVAAPAPLPESLAGLDLVEAVAGPEALAQVSQLHGAEIPVVSAAIARYLGPAGRAEVWFSEATDPAAARRMARRMATRIEEGNSPFEPPRLLPNDVWETRGMGQAHYFFARARAVWWISADDDLAEPALTAILEVAEAP